MTDLITTMTIRAWEFVTRRKLVLWEQNLSAAFWTIGAITFCFKLKILAIFFRQVAKLTLGVKASRVASRFNTFLICKDKAITSDTFKWNYFCNRTCEGFFNERPNYFNNLTQFRTNLVWVCKCLCWSIGWFSMQKFRGCPRFCVNGISSNWGCPRFCVNGISSNSVKSVPGIGWKSGLARLSNP